MSEPTQEYELTNEESEVVSRLAISLKAISSVSLISGWIGLIAVVASPVFQGLSAESTEDSSIVGDIFAWLFSMRSFVTLFLALFFVLSIAIGNAMKSSAVSFEQSTKTQGKDMTHVAEGLSQLGGALQIMGTILTPAVILIVILVGLITFTSIL
jgi:hypothetical protein